MKKFFLMAALFFSCISFGQEVTFEDGTRVHLNELDISYKSIRKFSAGVGAIIDGNAGTKSFIISYLNPEKFYTAINLGTAGLNAETIIFFSGTTKIKNRYFNVKYAGAGSYVNVYVLKLPLEKRKEWGVYLNINDYGHV